MKREDYNNLLFAGIIILLIAVSLATYRSLMSYTDDVKWVRHSNLVISQVEKIMSIVKDAETGHRGYQLTQDSIFLEPYLSSINSIDKEIGILDSLFLKEDAQIKRGDSLRLLIEKQYRIITTILRNEEESKRFMSRYENNLLIVGRENMDKLRSLCQRMIDFESKVLKTRMTKEYDFRNIAPVSLLTYAFIAIGAAGIMFLRTNDELKRRRRTEGSLKQSLLELDEKEKRYRSLFDRSIDPIFLVTDNFRIVDINAAMMNRFGLDAEKDGDMELGKIFANPDEFEKFKNDVRTKQQVRDYEVILVDQSGSKMICLINCLFIPDFSAGQSCYQGIVHDITLRKKAERELLIAEKLSMTGKIARTIAHEVRNPLTNLHLAIDQLKEELPATEVVKVHHEIFGRNLKRIDQLITDLLNSSKPRDLKLELVSLETIIKESAQLVVDRINLNRMTLETHAENLPRVFVDKELMKIAIVNIMVNAIEAMQPESGKLTLKTSQADGRIILAISDNGKGIPEDELNKLFDPFFTAKQGGMGLGLTSTQNILNSHGIGIDVESRVNVGTTFKLIFKLPD